jgi:hypothetical protein
MAASERAEAAQRPTVAVLRRRAKRAEVPLLRRAGALRIGKQNRSGWPGAGRRCGGGGGGGDGGRRVG